MTSNASRTAPAFALPDLPSMTRLGLAGLITCLLASVVNAPAHAEIVDFRGDGVEFRIDTDRLALSGAPDGHDTRVMSLAAMDAQTQGLAASATDARWTAITQDGSYDVQATFADGVLDISITSMQVGILNWPVSNPLADVGYALPILGEGRRVPADDEDWQLFLKEVLDGLPAAEHLSQTFFTEQNPDYSATWLLRTPWDADVTYSTPVDLLSVGFRHEFTPLNLAEAYQINVRFGPANWIDGALINRAHLQEIGIFRSLEDKIAQRPAIARLAGAPHIYLWEKGPLKALDVAAWRRFVRIFGARRHEPGTFSHALWQVMLNGMPDDMRADIEAALEDAQGEEGFVSNYSRGVMIYAVNSALPQAVPRQPVDPLAGGHDPAAGLGHIMDIRAALALEFGDSLSPPETWGGGMSTGLVESLSNAGIQHAWLGVENWLDAIWHNEAVSMARDAGYLVGTYDSYASAHAEDQEGSWQTAQMGTSIFEGAGYLDQSGTAVTGFLGRGAYVNPVAAQDYARSRIQAVATAAGLNSYFLDVDGTGLVFEDYTEGRQTTRTQAYQAILSRMAFTSGDLGLVLGSETGTAAFAGQLDFAHGIATPVFDWMDPRMRRNPDPEFYIGNYWPAEAPDRFFTPTPVPPRMERVIYDPAFRLPLFQIALHDAVVTTHHWHFGSLKAEGQQQRNALFELLYMVPPLYHLSHATSERDLPAIIEHVAAFAPLHERLMTQAMTGFRFLSQDHLVQETRFADGSVLIANFRSEAFFLPDGIELSAMSVIAMLPGQAPMILSLTCSP